MIEDKSKLDTTLKQNGMSGSGRSRTASRGSYRPVLLLLLLVFCSIVYYFGELVDLAGLRALHLKFFDSVHDIHRLLFLAPIIYAGYIGRTKGAIIVTLVSLAIFLPRAFFISPYPDPTLRAVLFTIIAGALGVLTGVIRNESRRRGHLETVLGNERDKLRGILDRMADGVAIVSPDYKIRFLNPKMVADFGPGEGEYCYKYLHHRNNPCEACRLPNVMNGKVERWEYSFPNGRTYEVLASPFVDSDGVFCQLATFRDITGRKKE